MRLILSGLALVLGASLLSACTVHDRYYNDGGGYSTYQDDATNGYNRDYQKPRKPKGHYRAVEESNANDGTRAQQEPAPAGGGGYQASTEG